VTISFVISACLSVRLPAGYNSASIGRIFKKVNILEFFENLLTNLSSFKIGQE